MSEKIIVACPNCQTRFVAPLEKFLPSGRKVRCAKCGNAWFHGVEGYNPDEQSSGTESQAPSGESQEFPVQPAVMPRVERSPSIMDRAIAKVADPVGGLDNRSNTDSEQASTVNVAGMAAAGGAAAIGAAMAGSSRAENSFPDATQGAKLSKMKARKRRWFPRILFYSFVAALVAGALGYFFKDEIVARAPALDPSLTSWKRNVDAVVSKVIPVNPSLRIDNVKYDIEEADGQTALLVTADVINDSNALKKAPNLVAKILGRNDAVLNEASLVPEAASSEIAGGDRAPYFLRMPNPPPGLRKVEVDFAQ